MAEAAGVRHWPGAAWDRAMTAIYLAATMGMTAVLLIPTDGAETGPHLAFLSSWVVLYGWSWWRWLRARGPLGRGGLALLLFSAAALLSAVWSPQPVTSAAYAIALMSNVAFVTWSARRFPLATFLRIALLVIASLAIVGWLLHGIGVDTVRYVDVHDRTTLLGTEPLRALFNHKITAGSYAAMAMVLAWFLLPGWWRWAACFGLGSFVLATGSNGSLVLVAVSIAAVGFLRLARGVPASAGVVVTLVLTAACLAAAVMPVAAPTALEALGRDPSMTGRFDLWAWGGRIASERPLLGWGYFGYPGSERAAADGAAIPRFATYALPHFHNAYLQMLVDLGLIGAIASIALLGWGLHANTRRGLASGDPARLATAAVLIVAIAAGMGMHAFFQYNHFLTLFVMRAVAETGFE